MSAPIANLNQFASMRERTRPLSITRIRSAPTTAPKTVPTPPVSATPPITEPAMACNSRVSPRLGKGDFRRKTWTVPARPARIEHIMKQVNLTLVTGMPIDRAASMNPPVALIQLPKFVIAMIAEASKNERHEPDETKPGKDRRR